MPANLYLALFTTIGLWLSVTNLLFLRHAHRLKRYMPRRQYQRLQTRHLLLSLAGVLLMIGSVIAYFILRRHLPMA